MITHAVVSVPDVVDRGFRTESLQRPTPGPCCSFHVKGLLYGSLSDFALPATSTARVTLLTVNQCEGHSNINIDEQETRFVWYKYGHPDLRTLPVAVEGKVPM